MTTNCCCFACVAQSEVAILEQCGRFHGVASAGCTPLCCCLGVTVAGTVSSRIQQLDVPAETKTHDNVFVTLKVNVQYQAIAQAERRSFYSLQDHTVQIRAYVYDVVRSAVPKITLDKVFEQKEEIAMSVKDELKRSMEEYGWNILQVLVADIIPDHKVKSAMNEINAAQRLRVAAVDRAEAEKILIVKKAEADAESKFLGGVGIARQRKAIAEGLKDSVLAFTDDSAGTSTREVMDLVLVTQYFDTLKELGEKSHASTIFLSGTGGAQSSQADATRGGMLEAHAAMLAQAQGQAAAQQQDAQRAAQQSARPQYR